MPLFNRQAVRQLGEDAERQACRYLKKAGLKIVATNYRAPRGEIDIIATDRDAYVFVEVRLRATSVFGNAGDSISTAKQRRIIHAATHYLQKHRLWDKVPCRFDTLCMDQHTGSGNYQLEWTPNAFWAN